MRGFSKVVIAGNLTRDPELRATPSGSQVCSFAVAVNRRFKAANGEFQDAVSYFDCSAWGRTGETINQYLHKGSPILVSGRLDQRSWEDKTTGQKRYGVEIMVDDFNFLSGDISRGASNDHSADGNSTASASAANNSAADGSNGPNVPPADEEINLNEIPF